MGQLIACRRRELGMTQRQLAAKLNITDKAVSKWERGLSCPDVTLLAGLAQALEISTGELLDPRQNSDGTDTQREKAVEQTLAYAAHSVRRVSRRVRLISFASLSAAFFIGILTCAICDWCIEGAFTWSWYPVSSILFAWAVLAPAVLMERGGVGTSLGVLTLLILPYLYVLSLLVGDSRLMMALSIPCAAIGMGYLWAIYLLFRFLPHKRCLSGAISLVLAVPVSFLINLVMANLLGDALFGMCGISWGAPWRWRGRACFSGCICAEVPVPNRANRRSRETLPPRDCVCGGIESPITVSLWVFRERMGRAVPGMASLDTIRAYKKRWNLSGRGAMLPFLCYTGGNQSDKLRFPP